MKQRKLLSALLAFCMLICLLPATVRAEGEPVIKIREGEYLEEVPAGYSAENHGRIGRNYGTVIASHTGSTIDDNYGTVNDNFGTVTYNHENAVIDRNLGSLYGNDGTVTENYGTIEFNRNLVTTNCSQGTVVTNRRTVTTNNGTVKTNDNFYGDETIVNNDGTVEVNKGTITNNGSEESDDGTVISNQGTITTNYGTVTTNTVNGTITDNKGALTNANAGTIERNNSALSVNDTTGVIKNNNAVITNNYGTVASNTNSISINNAGATAMNEQAGVVQLNYGKVYNRGTVNSNRDRATEYRAVVIFTYFPNTILSYQGMENAFGYWWLERRATGVITAAAPEGYVFGYMTYPNPDNVSIVQNSDRLLTITVTGGKETNIFLPILLKYSTVTVTNGNGSGVYTSGSLVTIEAVAPAEDMVFDSWTGADDLTFSTGSAATPVAKFNMPDHDVALTAVFFKKTDLNRYLISQKAHHIKQYA